MTGNEVFLLVLVPPALPDNLPRDLRSKTGEAIFLVSRTQEILLAGFQSSKISLLPYPEAPEISMISPDSNSLTSDLASFKLLCNRLCDRHYAWQGEYEHNIGPA